MSMTTKKVSLRFVVGPSAGRLSSYRDARTGQVVVDEIVSETGKVVVKGGPITGGKNRQVLKPPGRTKLQTKQLDKLIALMKLPA